jgi:hypothetical protein
MEKISEEEKKIEGERLSSKAAVKNKMTKETISLLLQ